MSKNTELYKKASEAIPGEDDKNFVLRQVRNGWCMGYEKAEKDTIERVIEWVKRNGYLYVNRVKEGDEYAGEFMEEPFIESLRKAMEEEK